MAVIQDYLVKMIKFYQNNIFLTKYSLKIGELLLQEVVIQRILYIISCLFGLFRPRQNIQLSHLVNGFWQITTIFVGSISHGVNQNLICFFCLI